MGDTNRFTNEIYRKASERRVVTIFITKMILVTRMFI